MDLEPEHTLLGAIVVDKPAGWTSHDVIGRLRRLAGTRRIGHLGTLDPMATGVLPLLVGKATRLAQFFPSVEKIYEGTIRFGFSTSTYDAEGVPTSSEIAVELNCDGVEALLQRFRGRFWQTPPAVSAKKISGVPAYKLARQNIEVVLAPVEVEVASLSLLRCEGNEIGIRVQCSAGTYIRSIAHDLGAALGTGAHLTALRRLRSSGFDISVARSIEQLQQLADAKCLSQALIPASSLLPELPTEVVDDAAVLQIRQGRQFRTSPFRQRNEAQHVKAITNSGELIAIGELKLPFVYHPILVL